MNRYEPSTPRTAFGVIACALTVATFALLVAGPASLAVQDEGSDGHGSPAGKRTGRCSRPPARLRGSQARRQRAAGPRSCRAISAQAVQLERGRLPPQSSPSRRATAEGPGALRPALHLISFVTNAFSSDAIRASEGWWMYIMWPDS